ncbi:MAG: hydroxymethylglutaryl-CoA synthase [Myxococcaceae bacterium]
MKVGIDAIGLAVPPTYLELAELARARAVAPEKYTEGLGTVRMSVPLADEDTVTLSVRAAGQALASAGVDAKQIGLCIVGTETAVDHSKPVSSYVQGLIGLPSHCRVFEAKHACYGGTAGLQTALDWIRSGSAAGRKALVICADIARYGLKTPGEPTQGAGAVALLVSESPRLVSFETGRVGTWSSDVHDFWRPLYSKDAVVDGHYSVTCYLQAVEGALADYRKKVPAPRSGRLTDSFAAIAYHVPYGKMARKAHRQLRALDGDAEPDESFERQVAAGLTLPSQVGNIYTGSLYLSLASLLALRQDKLDGKQVALFSYGSGCCAELFDGTVEPGAQERVRSSGILELLEQRRKLEVPDYEAVFEAREDMDQRPARATTDSGPLRYLGVQHHRRYYMSPKRQG